MKNSGGRILYKILSLLLIYSIYFFFHPIETCLLLLNLEINVFFVS